jgi:hypothetical protein
MSGLRFYYPRAEQLLRDLLAVSGFSGGPFLRELPASFAIFIERGKPVRCMHGVATAA